MNNKQRTIAIAVLSLLLVLMAWAGCHIVKTQKTLATQRDNDWAQRLTQAEKALVETCQERERLTKELGDAKSIALGLALDIEQYKKAIEVYRRGFRTGCVGSYTMGLQGVSEASAYSNILAAQTLLDTKARSVLNQ